MMVMIMGSIFNLIYLFTGMKDRKQLLEEIMDDVAKNQLSREIELDLV